MDISTIKSKSLEEVEKANSLAELEVIYRRYLGRKGELTAVFQNLKNLPEKERKEQGRLANQIKQEILDKIEKKKKELSRERKDLEREWIDVTAPGLTLPVGHLHPLTQVQRQIEDIFQSMGFAVVEGPEIETDWYNFDALNIPVDHPARDVWDTFWLRADAGDQLPATSDQQIKEFDSLREPEAGSQKPVARSRLLLRTHTSPVQIRYMEKHQPPLRIIAPGRVYRHEATDASHDFQFYQVEGLMVDKEVNVANFKAIILEFFRRFFKRDLKIRLRPSYFPFTEPSFEVDVSCLICQGKGCRTCQRTGWIEMMGAGMVHPNVFKAVRLNPKNWQGFAFGVGMDRLVMMKYKIDDIRWFHSGDLRFLNQF